MRINEATGNQEQPESRVSFAHERETLASGAGLTMPGGKIYDIFNASVCSALNHEQQLRQFMKSEKQKGHNLDLYGTREYMAARLRESNCSSR